MKKNLDRNAIQEVLENLETRLEAYLVEWRRELSIREWPEADIDCRQNAKRKSHGGRPCSTQSERK
jgi:hypothetical protein